MRFSERYGHKPVKDIIQLESIDSELKNGLWSLLQIHCWNKIKPSSGSYGGTEYYITSDINQEHFGLCQRMWFNHFKRPLDNLHHDWDSVLREIREIFYKFKWYEIYDFIEFVANNYEDLKWKNNFCSHCNSLLEREMSAYRFLDGVITKITEKEEIQAIQTAIDSNPNPVITHIRRALELLSDRDSPDYRNSIKESISSVESLVGLSVQTKGRTLGHLLKQLESDNSLHPALTSAFSKLYGYTSDEGGIRHALMDADSNDFHDAKFMLVACSAFTNYINGKNEGK